MRHSIPSSDFFWNYIQFIFSTQQVDRRFREVQLKFIHANSNPQTIKALPALRVYQTWYPAPEIWAEAELEIPQYIKSKDTSYWLTLFPYAAAISCDFTNFWENPKQWIKHYQQKFSLHPPMTGIETHYGLTMSGESRQITIDLQTCPGWALNCENQSIRQLTLKVVELPPVTQIPETSEVEDMDSNRNSDLR